MPHSAPGLLPGRPGRCGLWEGVRQRGRVVDGERSGCLVWNSRRRQSALKLPAKPAACVLVCRCTAGIRLAGAAPAAAPGRQRESEQQCMGPACRAGPAAQAAAVDGGRRQFAAGISAAGHAGRRGQLPASGRCCRAAADAGQAAPARHSRGALPQRRVGPRLAGARPVVWCGGGVRLGLVGAGGSSLAGHVMKAQQPQWRMGAWPWAGAAAAPLHVSWEALRNAGAAWPPPAGAAARVAQPALGVPSPLCGQPAGAARAAWPG